MPYRRLAELPERIRRHLPRHAQEIWREAFNHAWERYADPSTRLGHAPREQTAQRVAWAAVKQVYEKDVRGRWRRKHHARP
jgi:cation transport regulator